MLIKNRQKQINIKISFSVRSENSRMKNLCVNKKVLQLTWLMRLNKLIEKRGENV
jgi:hypothetical protein